MIIPCLACCMTAVCLSTAPKQQGLISGDEQPYGDMGPQWHEPKDPKKTCKWSIMLRAMWWGWFHQLGRTLAAKPWGNVWNCIASAILWREARHWVCILKFLDHSNSQANSSKSKQQEYLESGRLICLILGSGQRGYRTQYFFKKLHSNYCKLNMHMQEAICHFFLGTVPWKRECTCGSGQGMWYGAKGTVILKWI